MMTDDSVFWAATLQVLGSMPKLGKVDSAFHPLDGW